MRFLFATIATVVGASSFATGCSSRPTAIGPAKHEAVRAAFESEARRIASEELDHAMADWEPSAGVIVIIDAGTGYVLSSEGRVHGKSDSRLAWQEKYRTGSTLKTFTIAAALENEAVTADAVIDCSTRIYDGSELHDPTPHGKLSLGDVLATSSNVGTSRVYDALGFGKLEQSLKLLHLGETAEVAPLMSPRDRMLFAIGESTVATPLQVAAAYAALANDGFYNTPAASRAAAAHPERVLSSATVRTVLLFLESAVASDIGTGKSARVEGLRVAGKTGTSEDENGHVYASFVGTVLDREPRLVTLVGLVDPQHDGSGPSAAAPVFARVAKRIEAARVR